jgi:hypothetical protein
MRGGEPETRSEHARPVTPSGSLPRLASGGDRAKLGGGIGMANMGDDANSDWWLGADRLWRKGTPPADWRQADDGRWHPPPTSALVTTSEMPVVDDVPPEDGRPRQRARRRPGPGAGRPANHAHRGPQPRRDDSVRGRPEWVRVVVPAAAAVVVLSLIGVAVASAGGGDGSGDRAAGAAGVAEAPSQSTVPATTSTTASSRSQVPDGSSTTTDPQDGPSATSSTTDQPGQPGTSATPTSVAADPFANCTDAQLAAVDRPGNRPPSWYFERLDRDGNGVLCD